MLQFKVVERRSDIYSGIADIYDHLIWDQSL